MKLRKLSWAEKSWTRESYQGRRGEVWGKGSAMYIQLFAYELVTVGPDRL